MHNALQTLFYPFESGQAEPPVPDERCLFLNAMPHPFLAHVACTGAQAFKPYYDAFEETGHACMPVLEDLRPVYDLVFVLLPKNRVEAAFTLAQGLSVLKDGGRLMCAADNKAGGAGLGKTLKSFGFAGVDVGSKNKARVAVVEKSGTAPDMAAVQAALKAGGMQPVLNGVYVSQPGVYGWNKIDTGSALLVDYLPDTLSGDVADFGCGYGFLSVLMAELFKDLNSLYFIDADARAVACTSQNLKDVQFETQGHWLDLTIAQPDLVGKFDHIVMNPPFHEGKATDISIGQAFIQSAAQSLKRGGTLYMVANAHLPYEAVLQEHFDGVEKLAEKSGFKVYRAVCSFF